MMLIYVFLLLVLQNDANYTPHTMSKPFNTMEECKQEIAEFGKQAEATNGFSGSIVIGIPQCLPVEIPEFEKPDLAKHTDS